MEEEQDAPPIFQRTGDLFYDAEVEMVEHEVAIFRPLLRAYIERLNRLCEQTGRSELTDAEIEGVLDEVLTHDPVTAELAERVRAFARFHGEGGVDEA